MSENEFLFLADKNIRAFNYLRSETRSDLPIPQLQILLYLWLNGSCNQAELARSLNLKRAAISRHCRSLSTFYKEVEKEDSVEVVLKGQALIEMKRDLVRTNYAVINLTHQTRIIIENYFKILGGKDERVNKEHQQG